MPGKAVPELESMMKAQTTDSEKTETQVFSAYISMASVKEKRARLSAQLRILSASAAYNALPYDKNSTSIIIDNVELIIIREFI